MATELVTRINCGEYILNIDSRCVWISRMINGKNKEYERRVSGYYTTLEDCLKDFVIKAKGNGAKDLENCIALIKEAEDAALEIISKVEHISAKTLRGQA